MIDTIKLHKVPPKKTSKSRSYNLVTIFQAFWSHTIALHEKTDISIVMGKKIYFSNMELQDIFFIPFTFF